MNLEAQRHDACCELVHEVADAAGEVRLKVAGASMLPAIWPGDVITVRHCELAALKPGQIALFRRDGKLTAHRVQQLSGGRLITRGDSVPTFDPPVEANEIVGQVIAISRAGITVRTDQAFWQRAVSSLLRRSDLLMRGTLYLSRRLRRSWDVRTSWTSLSL